MAVWTESRDAIRAQIEDEDRCLTATVDAIRHRASSEIGAVVAEAYGRKLVLLRRLARLDMHHMLNEEEQDAPELDVLHRERTGSTTGGPVPGAPEAGHGRRSVRAVMLDVLAANGGSAPGSEVRRAVEAEGWRRAAAAKMRSRLVRERLMTIDGVTWTLTAKGHAASSGETTSPQP